MYCWFTFIMSVLKLYIINKNYQWILTFGLLNICCLQNYCFFLYMYVPLFFLDLYFIYLYKQWFKNKVKHKQRAHYISVDLRINSQVSLLHGERALQLPVKYIRDFFFTFARITYYLEYIWFTHNIFCILQHDWRCNMDFHYFF
jgi:hypothetical protein